MCIYFNILLYFVITQCKNSGGKRRQNDDWRNVLGVKVCALNVERFVADSILLQFAKYVVECYLVLRLDLHFMQGLDEQSRLKASDGYGKVVLDA